MLCPQKFHLLVSFAYSLDPDQAKKIAGQKVRPDLDPNFFVFKTLKKKSAA